MMKKLAIPFAVILAAIVALMLLLTGRMDKKAPVIEFGNDAVVLEGTDVSVLLSDVTAYDEEDGDVTDAIVISRYYLKDDGTGVITYTAKDQSNNIATKKRTFQYSQAERQMIETALSQLSESTTTAGDSTDSSSAGQENGQSGTQESGSEQGTGTDTAQGTGTDTTQGTGTDTAQGAGASTGERNLSDAEYEAKKTENAASGIPYMRLSVHEVTLKVGDRFSIYNYIEEVWDDKDTINTMLRLEDNVDTTKVGVYQAKVYARDGEGNLSNTEYLTVVVQ